MSDRGVSRIDFYFLVHEFYYVYCASDKVEIGP